jgi:adenylate kinase
LPEQLLPNHVLSHPETTTNKRELCLFGLKPVGTSQSRPVFLPSFTNTYLRAVFKDLNRFQMLNIVLFGPPGAGKGTQSEALIEKYKLVHLSTGDIFRANINGKTDLGTLAKSYMDKGELVPDEVTIQMLESEVNKRPNAKGFIFDGFPRTKAQAIALDVLMDTSGEGITKMLALEVEEEELKTRLLHRAKTSGRADDANPEIIQNRIDVYNRETAPVASHYAAQSKYVGVDGIGNIEEISERLFAAIEMN